MLTQVPFLAQASEHALRHLIEHAELRPFQRREFLFHEGDPVEWAYVIVKGDVAATITSPAGTAVTLHVAGPAEVCGRVDLFAGGTFTVSAQALSRGSAIALPAKELRRVLESEPACLRQFTADLAVVVTTLTRAVGDLVFLDVSRRLAALLLESADDEGTVRMPGTQSDFAALLGVARQTLNTALSRLAHDGVVSIDSPRVLRVTNTERLAGLAGMSPG